MLSTNVYLQSSSHSSSLSSSSSTHSPSHCTPSSLSSSSSSLPQSVSKVSVSSKDLHKLKLDQIFINESHQTQYIYIPMINNVALKIQWPHHPHKTKCFGYQNTFGCSPVWSPLIKIRTFTCRGSGYILILLILCTMMLASCKSTTVLTQSKTARFILSL